MNKLVVTSLTAALLGGCLDIDSNDTRTAPLENAAILTVNSDNSSSDLVAVGNDYESFESLNPQAFSDVVLSASDNSVYLINRFGQNNIIKYNSEEMGYVDWQYSTNNPDIANQESNPYQIIEKSSESAYILRYNTGEIWQVNPSAESDSEFKIAEIDLSSFDSDGIPEMVAATLYNDILYIALQRLTFYKSDNDSFLIAIDTSNNSFIDLSENDDNTTAMALNVRNPKELKLVDNELYVVGVGRYAVTDWNTGELLEATEYTGGIEKINLDSLTSETIVDDGDQDTHPYGQIYSVSVSGTDLVFTGYNAWGNLNTYIKIGDTSPVIFDEDINGEDIRFAKFDPSGQLWVGIADAVNPRTLVYSKNENNEYEVVQTVLTTLLPSDIIFK
ncbi:MAG: hypothetical protein V7785_07755 [Bermanella sp.]